MEKSEIKKTIEVNSNPANVFKKISDESELKKWWVDVPLLELKQGGSIKFHDKGSGFDISDDAILKLENGKEFRLHDLKISQMIGYGGSEITYDYLDNLGKNNNKKYGNGFASKFGGFGKAFGR